MVEKIYHLADLHIRNLQRHKEYKSVFEKFLKQVKKDNLPNSIIYLAGDIAHSKTEMSPELVSEISRFLTECAKLKETFIITGNHDCNLNNNYRLDVLTPIIDNLNNPRIHYLRDTGIYEYENLTFVVYSILDHKDNWPSGYDVEGENTICLFHGPVNKAETDIGYTVSSNSFTADMFNGFDMGLLGDIHRRQVISNDYEETLEVFQYEVQEFIEKGFIKVETVSNGARVKMRKKTAHVAYAGSMIQQNHGEMLEGHGYLIWDVKTRTFESFDIHNDYGFLTVDVVDGKIPQWVYDEIDTKLPSNPRLRLRFTNTPPAEMKLRITELKKLFKVAEVTVTRTDTMGQLRTNNKLNKNIVGDVTDITFQNQLIRDYLERQYLLEDSDLDAIQEINKEFNSRLSSHELAENILWTPKVFEFDNMFSYGEKNKVDFTDARGVVGIFAPNAAGKSSLFDALSFCIFDKTSRSNSSKHILNNRKDGFTCKFNFEIDGIDYFIERKAKYVRKRTAVKVDVEFWKDDGGVITSLNGEQRRDTNQSIEKYLGKFDDFVLTTLSLQGNNALFIDKSQSERKEVLSQFIGIDVFDKLYQMVSDENRENATLIRKFKKDDFTTKLAELEISYLVNIKSYKEEQVNLIEIDKVISKCNTELNRLNGDLVKLNSDLVGIDELINRKKNLKNALSTATDSRKKIEERLTKLEELQIQLDEIIDSYDEDDLKKQLARITSKKGAWNRISSEIDIDIIKKESLIERLEHLKTHKYNPECDVCLDNNKSIIETTTELENELYLLNKNLSDKIIIGNRLNEEITTLIPSEKSWNIFKETEDKENHVDREITNLHSKLAATETRELELKHQIDNQESLIQEYYKNEKEIRHNQKLRAEMKVVSDELRTSTNLKADITNKLLSLNGKVSSLTTQRENITERITEVKNLESQTKLYGYYLNALGKDGVSYELVEKALPMIEGEVNNILGQIVEFGMQLEIDGKNINAYIVYNDQRWSLEMCSGMERFISGLAIRVALINICNLPRTNFLVIDEGFGSLDPEVMQSLFMLFTYLKTQFDFVMVISHIDSMRDVVDDLIEIKKEDGFSHVKY